MYLTRPRRQRFAALPNRSPRKTPLTASRANTILPGVIDAPHVVQFVAPDMDPDEISKQRAALVPMGRQGSAWDTAHTAIYLASDEASFVTGINLPVDGGMIL